MGVFARLFGRSKAAQETTVTEEPAGAGPDEAEAEVAETARTAEAEGTVQAEGTAEDGQEAATEADAAGAGAAENAEIPKQQSAAGAADREAGEGART